MFKFVSTTGRKSNTHCSLCGKGRIRGNLVSHSKQRTKRVFRPNLQAYWVLEAGRRVRHMFCVKCLRRIKKQVSKAGNVPNLPAVRLSSPSKSGKAGVSEAVQTPLTA